MTFNTNANQQLSQEKSFLINLKESGNVSSLTQRGPGVLGDGQSRFKNEPLLRSLTRSNEGGENAAAAQYGDVEKGHRTLAHSSSQELKTISMTDASIKEGIPSLYISQKQIVVLNKFKQEIAEADLKLDKFLSGRRGGLT